MADDEDIAALVVDNGSGMCKGKNESIGFAHASTDRRIVENQVPYGMVSSLDLGNRKQMPSL